MKNTLRIVFLALCALAPLREVSAAFLIRDGKLQTDLNANTNRITNATDYVTVGGVSLTNAYALAAAGGGSGATNFIFNAVTNSAGYLLFTGYTATTRTAYFNIGTNSGTSIDTNAVIALINASTNTSARLASNVWAAANSTTNYVRRTGDTMTSALKISRTNDIGLTFGAFGTRNSILGVGQNDALGSGLTFVPHTANPQVPVWTLGGVYDVNSGAMYGTALRGSGLGEIDGTIGAGDFFRLEFIGADSVTQRMLTVTADALGVTGSSALLSVSNATFSGNGAGITGVNIASLANGSTILTNGGPVATNYLPRTGGTMTGGLTNNVGFTGNGAGLTNLAVQSVITWGVRPEGSFNARFRRMFAPGIDDLSVDSTTNIVSFQFFGESAQTIATTGIVYGIISPGKTSVVIRARANQPSQVVVFRTVTGTSQITTTQTLTAAQTDYIWTNVTALPATDFVVEQRLTSTNSANMVHIGYSITP